ncbi:helix-turn-helix domain-containing protein [Agromyces tropicus]|uniref:TetR/AcrR family transcriptional regulator n=1 Tax=Agromyces tropicus TaxID=555371 RepID=UPI0031D54319
MLASARDLFAARGFGAVSMRDVAADAGVSHPTVRNLFGSMDALLDAVVTDSEADLQEALEGRTLDLDLIDVIARAGRDIPGYVELFTVLAGAATLPEHPAHERFRVRDAEFQALGARMLQDARDRGELPADLDIPGEARRLNAAWDGLQVISRYLPEEVDVPDALAHRIARLRGRAPTVGPFADVEPLPISTMLAEEPADEAGYAVGRRRRADIIDQSTTIFARDGYHGASLRDIAGAVGVNASTLLHHFGSKEALLAAVLAHRDAAMAAREADGDDDPVRLLRELGAAASRDARTQPGLISIYAVLSTEAVAPSHPAHAYFQDRFARAIRMFENVLQRAAARGATRPDVDPHAEAIELTALWDGLQLQWGYDADAVDIGRELDAHLAGVLREGVGRDGAARDGAARDGAAATDSD